MKRALLLSISVLLLGLPAATAFCASCASGACAEMAPGEATGPASAHASHGDVQLAETPQEHPKEQASQVAMPPCHAAMMATTAEKNAPENAAPAEALQRAEPESTPCHGDAEQGPATVAMSCCDGMTPPPALPLLSGGSSGDAPVAALPQATRAPHAESPTRKTARLGEPPPETRSALHVLHAVWLI